MKEPLDRPGNLTDVVGLHYRYAGDVRRRDVVVSTLVNRHSTSWWQMGCVVRGKVLIIVPFLLIARFICMHLWYSDPGYCSYDALYACTQPSTRSMQSPESKHRPRGTHSHKATRGYQGRRLTQLSTARSHSYYSTFHYLISSNNSPCHPPLSLSFTFPYLYLVHIFVCFTYFRENR